MIEMQQPAVHVLWLSGSLFALMALIHADHCVDMIQLNPSASAVGAIKTPLDPI